MAFTVGEISAPITADMSGFNRAIDRVKSAGRQMTAMFTVPLLAAGTLAVKTAADYETLRQSMDALNGSAEEGARQFNRLKKFSATTPFQLKDLADAQNMLQGFGLEADKAFESMKMIGDIAAITGADIQGIGIAFGQAAAEGKAMTRDIRQFINQGVPMIKLLADTMGVAQSEVLSLAEEGKISFDILQQAFRDATSEGGMFADGMERQSKTIAGLFSTLKDNASIALGELGDTIVETLDLKTVITNLTTGLQVITQRFAALSDDAKKDILKIAGLFAAGGPFLIAISTAGKVVAGLAKLVRSQFAIITASFAAGVGIGQWFVDNWNTLFGKAEKDFTSFADSTVRGMKKIIDPIMGFAEAAFGAGSALSDFTDLFKDLPSAVDSMKSTEAAAKGVNDEVSKFAGASNPIGHVTKQSAQLANTVNDMVRPSLEGMRASVSSVFEGMSLLEISTVRLSNKMTEGQMVAAQFGNALGQALSQAVLHAKRFDDVLKNILKQLASQALMQFVTAIVTGGSSLAAGSIGKALFGGLFHSGGVVPGSGSKMIRAQGGEGVFTPSQMAAIGNMGGQQISASAMQHSFEKALQSQLQKLGPEDIYVLSRKGQFSY